MLRDDRATSGVAAFYRWWLLLDELGTLEKDVAPETLDAPLRQAMMAEAPALGVHLTLERDGAFDELLLAPYTFVNERLARHYGIAGVTGDEMRKVPVETAPPSGPCTESPVR